VWFRVVIVRGAAWWCVRGACGACCVLRVACCVMRRVGDVRWPNYYQKIVAIEGARKGKGRGTYNRNCSPQFGDSTLLSWMVSV
jgi:hypothetical protein